MLDIYENCVSLMLMLLDFGKQAWNLLNTKIIVLLNQMPEGFVTDIIRDLFNPISNYTIIGFAMGSGFSLYLIFVLLKFLKIF